MVAVFSHRHPGFLCRLSRPIMAVGLALSLSACGGLSVEADYPENEDIATAESGSVFDFFRFGGKDTPAPTAADNDETLAEADAEADNATPSLPQGLGVNADLWRAALETVSFMPLASADPMGGTIITDWYNDPGQTDERVKLNVVISGLELRADAVRVSLFREKRSGRNWVTMATSATAARQLENIVLTKARDYKIARGNF